MWPWFQLGWIIIVPIAMIVVCLLMCIFMRGHVFGSCASCCGHGRSESDAQSNRKPQSDSRGSTA